MLKQGFRLGLCTGGGDCPGLNAAVRAVTRHAIGTYGMTVLGSRDGLTGLIEQPGDVRELSLDTVAHIMDQGGTILGTSNKGSPFREEKQAKATLQAIEASWKKHKLDALIVIGGDGTQGMARYLSQAGLPVVGVPKTIDNDLIGSDLTIGFSTAVQVATEAAGRLRSSADAHDRAMILEVMGRDAGHIALHTGIAASADACLIPEIPVDLNLLCQRVQAKAKAAGRNAYLIVCAEGATEKGKTQAYQEAVSGAKVLGGIGQRIAQAIHDQTGVDARVAVLGHIQRGGTPNAEDRLLATAMASRAVDLVARGDFGKIVTWAKGQLAEISYAQLPDARRPVDLGSVEIRTAEAQGICLGRPNAYQAPV
jgi:6-phosphofructokinase